MHDGGHQKWEERREQFECSYCGKKFDFKKKLKSMSRTVPSVSRQ
jgi:hypothetical protein